MAALRARPCVVAAIGGWVLLLVVVWRLDERMYNRTETGVAKKSCGCC